MRIEFVIL